MIRSPTTVLSNGPPVFFTTTPSATGFLAGSPASTGTLSTLLSATPSASAASPPTLSSGAGGTPDNSAIIAGVTVAGVVCVTLLGLAILFSVRKKRIEKEARRRGRPTLTYIISRGVQSSEGATSKMRPKSNKQSVDYRQTTLASAHPFAATVESTRYAGLPGAGPELGRLHGDSWQRGCSVVSSQPQQRLYSRRRQRGRSSPSAATPS